MSAAEQLRVARLHALVVTKSWKEAGKVVGELRYANSWNYAVFCAEFGAERWADISRQIEAAEQ